MKPTLLGLMFLHSLINCCLPESVSIVLFGYGTNRRIESRVEHPYIGSKLDFILCTKHFLIFGEKQTVKRIARELESALVDVRQTTCLLPKGRITVIACRSTLEYQRLTGAEWWKAAVTFGDTIVLQPIKILEKRNLVRETFRREVFHALVAQNNIEMPIWLQEGLATLAFGHCGISDQNDTLSAKEIEILLKSRKLDEFRKGWCAAAQLARRTLGDVSICQFLKNLCQKTKGGIYRYEN